MSSSQATDRTPNSSPHISSSEPPTHDSILRAHRQIGPYIHRTPLLTSSSLNAILSSPQFPGLSSPRLSLFFKLENHQRAGAFKARGAHCAILRLIERLGLEQVKRRGVATHSSGNHAAALALAARNCGVPAYVVMPANSVKNKIEATRAYGPREIVFSGPTATEREKVCEEVVRRTGAVVVPPYDYRDVVAGQGTVGVEMLQQYHEEVERRGKGISASGGEGFDAVIAPLGGGGLLSGVAIAIRGGSGDNTNSEVQRGEKKAKKLLVFGAEPSHSGADDARRGLSLSPPQRITSVSTNTIADGLRTPVGEIPWRIISDKTMVEGVYAVSEKEILKALRLVLERVKVWVEPSACVGVAVVGFCEEWRANAEKIQREEARKTGTKGRGWDVGIVLSGGNTTVEAVRKLFEDFDFEERQSAEGRGELQETARSRL